MLDDAALLRRYVDARAEADFGELVRRHIDGVYSAALRRLGGDAHLAHDVVQQVFIAMARQADSLCRHPLLVGWLYTTTRNQAANAVRTERRRQTREREAQTMSKINSEPLVEADWGRVAPVLDAVIDQLTEADRTAVLLRFVDRRPFGEIGAALRLSEDAARMRIDRALDKLRVHLHRRGIVSSAAALEAAMATHAVSAAPAGLAANVAGTALAAGPSILAATTGFAKAWSAGSFVSGAAAAAILAATVGATTWVTIGAHRCQETLAAGNLQLSAARQGLRQLRDEDEALARRLAALEQGAPVPSPLAAMQAAPAAGLAASASDEGSDARKFLEAFPQVRKMIAEAEKPHLEYLYGPFFRSAGLTPDQKNRLEAAMADASLRDLSITAAEGVSFSLLQVPAGDLVPLLGDQAARQFQEYQRLLPGWTLAFVTATEAAYRSASLSADQTGQLARMVAANSASYQGGGRIDLGRVDWNAVQAQGAASLSSAQSEALQNAIWKVQYQAALVQAWSGQAAAK